MRKISPTLILLAMLHSPLTTVAQQQTEVETETETTVTSNSNTGLTDHWGNRIDELKNSLSDYVENDIYEVEAELIFKKAMVTALRSADEFNDLVGLTPVGEYDKFVAIPTVIGSLVLYSTTVGVADNTINWLTPQNKIKAFRTEYRSVSHQILEHEKIIQRLQTSIDETTKVVDAEKSQQSTTKTQGNTTKGTQAVEVVGEKSQQGTSTTQGNASKGAQATKADAAARIESLQEKLTTHERKLRALQSQQTRLMARKPGGVLYRAGRTVRHLSKVTLVVGGLTLGISVGSSATIIWLPKAVDVLPLIEADVERLEKIYNDALLLNNLW